MTRKKGTTPVEIELLAIREYAIARKMPLDTLVSKQTAIGDRIAELLDVPLNDDGDYVLADGKTIIEGRNFYQWLYDRVSIPYGFSHAGNLENKGGFGNTNTIVEACG